MYFPPCKQAVWKKHVVQALADNFNMDANQKHDVTHNQPKIQNKFALENQDITIKTN